MSVTGIAKHRAHTMLTLCLALLSSCPQASDWPQYRGPERTGIGPVQVLSDQGSPEPSWSRNVGLGYSCPSIVGERLVTIGYDAEAGVDRIVCLHPSTGDELWKFEFESTDEPRYHGGGTLTTPTLHDGRAYCLSRKGQVHVLAIETGELVWARDYRAELGLADTFHGFSASPLLAGGHLLLQMGGRVVAVDPDGGEIRWQSEEHGDISYSNLSQLVLAGEEAIACVLAQDFLVLRLSDGEVLREYAWPLRGSAVHCATPIPVGDDRVFVSTAYGKGCALLDVSSDPPTPIWSSRDMRNKVTACALHEGHLYGFDESMLRCIDLAGNTMWRVRGLGLGSLSVVGDRLLILDSDGELIVAEATPEEFRELSRQKVLEGGVYWTMPVAVDGRVYVRNSLGDLRCFDHRPGTAAADPEVEGAADSTPAPLAASLFGKHAERVGIGGFEREGQTLQLQGTWAIPLRGLEPAPMTLTLASPDRWDLRLDEGGLLYTFDGERSWAIEPQGPRNVVGEELLESRELFPLSTLFTPTCPEGARTLPRSTRFAETDCWRVVAPQAMADGGTGGTRSFYFDVATSELVGSEGDGLSTVVFHEWRDLAGLILPGSITRYRAEDGQEHTLALTTATWITPPADFFEPPSTIQRLMRSPSEIARDNAALQERFAGALARYEPQSGDTPLGDDPVEILVHDGDLWFAAMEDEFAIEVSAEEDGQFPVIGIPILISFAIDEDERVSVLRIHMPGQDEDQALPCNRMPE